MRQRIVQELLATEIQYAHYLDLIIRVRDQRARAWVSLELPLQQSRTISLHHSVDRYYSLSINIY